MRLLFPVAVLLLASADTAAAHNVSGNGATGVTSDARSTVVTDDLPPGVTFEMLQNGLTVRLHNGSSALVVVREPRLRITPGHSVQWHLDAAHPSPGPPVQPSFPTVPSLACRFSCVRPLAGCGPTLCRCIPNCGEGLIQLVVLTVAAEYDSASWVLTRVSSRREGHKAFSPVRRTRADHRQAKPSKPEPRSATQSLSLPGWLAGEGAWAAAPRPTSMPGTPTRTAPADSPTLSYAGRSATSYAGRSATDSSSR